MEIADVIIFVVDEYAPTKGEYDANFNNGFITNIEKKYSAKCSVESCNSVEDIESKIKERFQKTQKEGKLYLSVGVSDLVDIRYQKSAPGGRGKFGIPKVALWVLKKIIIPFFNSYHFRTVFVTNVFNHCEEKKEEYEKKNNLVFAHEFVSMKEELKEQIKKVQESDYIVDKKKGKQGGEGIVDEEVFDEIRRKLYKLIEDEITYSSSSDSVYIKG